MRKPRAYAGTAEARQNSALVGTALVRVQPPAPAMRTRRVFDLDISGNTRWATVMKRRFIAVI